MKLSRLATIGFGLTQANAMFNRFFRRGRDLGKISALCDHTRKKRDHKREVGFCHDSRPAKFIQKAEDYQVKLFQQGLGTRPPPVFAPAVWRACGAWFAGVCYGLLRAMAQKRGGPHHPDETRLYWF